MACGMCSVFILFLSQFAVIDGTINVTIEQQLVGTLLGQPATLNCNYTTTGTGRITVEWSRDPAGANEVIVDHEVGADTFYYGDQVGRIGIVDSASLQINTTNSTDAGVYRCTVEVRGTGQDSGDVTLQIYKLPQNVSISSNESGNNVTGKSIKLTCNSTGGNPPPSSYIWQRNGTTINTTTSNTLVTQLMNTTGVYVYKCIAISTAWNVISTNNVTVNITKDKNTGKLSVAVIIGIAVVVTAVGGMAGGGGAYLVWKVKKKGLFRLKLQLLSDHKVEVQWTAPSGYEGSRYQVVYRRKGSQDWIYEPDVSTDDPPNYKHTVEFPQHDKIDTYELYVLVIVQGEKGGKSDIEEINLGKKNKPVPPPPGNNTSKTDDVIFEREGQTCQSQKIKLDPIVIDKQNSPEKKGKKKKKRKKVNKINASDEDKTPED